MLRRGLLFRAATAVGGGSSTSSTTTTSTSATSTTPAASTPGPRRTMVLSPKAPGGATIMQQSDIPGEDTNKLRDDDDGAERPVREYWEFEPTPEHRSLVLLLYRSILKELLKLPSVRKRTFITYVRLAYRRRARATEKLLVDECIEEARRGIYIASKHNAMKETGEYKFDDMFMPKDTGQDVKTYMEEVYDPVMSRQSVESVQDVMPGREHEHSGSLRGAHFQRDRLARDTMKEQLNRPVIKQADMHLRPPPPPDFGN